MKNTRIILKDCHLLKIMQKPDKSQQETFRRTWSTIFSGH